ncbi:flagellar biosynthetic protein FliO [Paenibacillus arenilitoris]|uniref:Flagellar biosynthetic protein FliO n=1 Tax=Paenibacillus arenilitoris TaxID=2772299 RepID=A0A927CPJ8_9BACL|nr:flagellar biosynthetic protein FliO [Paenibacillus arenilitoris]MBD2870727.1 flagellar biosynthetic protein FliO [Paenibacillus arenilitoris]
MLNILSSISTASALGMANWSRFAAAAATDGSSAERGGQLAFTGTSNVAGSLVWVIVSLAIVIVLIVLVIKWLSQRGRSWGTNRSLRSLGGVALGQNSSIQAVEIAGRVYIVGVGESITLLDKLDDPEQVRAVIAQLERKPESVWPHNLLAGFLDKAKKRSGQEKTEPTRERWNSASSFQTILQEKLSQQAERKQQLETLLHDPKSNERLMDDEK